jgi:hypothetical protein
MADKLRRAIDQLRTSVTDAPQRTPTPAEFRASLRIDADGRAVLFQPDPWQARDFEALDAAWIQLAGFEVRGDPIRRAFLTRPRGHSKTADLAVMAAWALTYACRPLRGIAAAADGDQAALLRDAVGRLARLNPALQVLDAQNWCVINKASGSRLDILSSDVPTSYGQLPDFIVCDEVGHWPEGRGEELWASLFSAAAKRAHCLLVVITNAGFQESWTWKVRETVRTDPAWYFTHLDGPQASWIPAARLAEQQRILPPLVFDRLWNNVWSSGSGDALQPADIDAALRLDGPTLSREDGFTYCAGLDLSVSRDHSALVVLGKHATGRLKLAQVRAWKPPPGGRVDLQIVEEACLAVHRQFSPRFLIDPYQAALLRQRLAARGAWCEDVPFVGNTLVQMASSLIEAFTTRIIDLFDDVDLISDLRRLRIKESPAGWRLDAPRTAAGHCDRAVALTLAVLGARRSALASPSNGLECVAFFCPGYGYADNAELADLNWQADVGGVRTFGRDEHGRVRYTGAYLPEDDDPGSHGVAFGYRPYSE